MLFLPLLFLFFSISSSTPGKECDNTKVKTAGTGTVLFNPTDIYKTCWSQDEIALLTARMILEDVIPDQRMVTIHCNDDVDDFVDYFKVVINTIRSNSKGRKRHIMLMALTDLLGGYLHHAILPLARRAYYSGAVDYMYMEKLIQLYEELKWFLRTNGQGWTKPIISHKDLQLPQIDFEKDFPKTGNDTCHKLMFYVHEPILRTKRASPVSIEKGIYFPTPFFDSKYRPTAIVVPFKKFALRNMESKRSAYVVMKYFISAYQCLKEKNAKSELIQKFVNNLYTWIEKDVVPKLNDDKFYSAFGGILRVENTLKQLGAKIGPVTCNTEEGEEEVGAIPALGCSSKRTKLFLVAMLVIIVAWFLIGTCFICYRIKNKKGKKEFKHAETKPSEESKSSSSFSSSRWSSILSKSSSKSSKTKSSDKKLCSCCESSISDKSTMGYTSTSDYDSEKSRKKDKRKSPTSFFHSKRKSSTCICPDDGPAVIDTKHSMKVLPSIAEMSEHSMSKDRNGSFKKIQFADDSGTSSREGGIKPCAPSWAQTPNTVPCPVLSDKSTNYSSSRSGKTQSQSKFDSEGETQTSLNYVESKSMKKTSSKDLSKRSDTTNVGTESIGIPLANSSLMEAPSQTTNEYGTSITFPDKNSVTNEVNKEPSPGTMDDLGEEEEYEEEPINTNKNNSKEGPYVNYHMTACHSSISGNYDLYRRNEANKAYVFGYDFQTSTSSDLSDDDT